ncbi:Dirigent protein 3 [Hibiscus syriacus]|uniref:Dirigent protein n=1 Tax=Hibiscus syriacus TaxID=106335 RepID=A0A6A2XXH5_HIBSY|nr:dirigent protein 22-like [Hibiscus syriacus]KAE8671665.1 Dirigent protein 3 [Hibiscus syriacus]
MAELLLKHSDAAAFLLTVVTLTSSFAALGSDSFSQNISPLSLGLNKPEKLSHLHFYFHDIVVGKNATAVRVAQAPTTTAASPFGVVVVLDDPLTVGPDIGSELVGKAQGIYAFASQTDSSLLVAYNFAFMAEEYNGSSLTILGRNTVSSAVREMPVVGGSGTFRFARGYVEARTESFDLKTGNTVVEYNVYVLHY